MSARLSGWAVAWCMVIGLVAASCGPEETPGPDVEDGSGGTSGSGSISVSVGLPPVSDEADRYVADFGSVQVGTTRSISVSIENHGRSEVVIRGAGLGAPFGSDLPPAGLGIMPGDMAIVTLRFEPTTPTLEAVRLSLTAESGAEVREIRVALVGLGVFPSFSCTPVYLDFGLVFVGDDAEVPFQCQNGLDVPVSVRTGLIDLGSEFTLAPTSDGEDPIVVPPHGALDGRVVFRPLEAGVSLGKLELRDVRGAPILRLAIQAVAKVKVCLEVLPPAVRFALCGPGTGTMSVRAMCDGVVLDSIGMEEGPSSTSFQISERSSLPLTLDIDDVAKFDVTFTPAEDDPAEVTGTIVVTSSGSEYRTTITGYTTGTRSDVFVVGAWEDGSKFALTAIPEDRNGDGAIDEQDVDVYVGDTRIEPIDETEVRSWWYDPDTNSVRFTFVASPMPGATVLVEFTASCPF